MGALSPIQVADKLGVSKDTVLRLVRSGKLPAVKVGWRTWRITEDSLNAFMAGKPAKKARKKNAGSN